MTEKLLPCPFCGGEAHVEQHGTPRQSCIIECESCGCRLETGEEGAMCGKSWNRRSAQPTTPKGWKLVPVEPTHRMLTQMLCGSATPEANYTDFWERRYQAMLAAAPKFGEEE